VANVVEQISIGGEQVSLFALFFFSFLLGFFSAGGIGGKEGRKTSKEEGSMGIGDIQI
jgi:hypothetical protein